MESVQRSGFFVVSTPSGSRPPLLLLRSQRPGSSARGSPSRSLLKGRMRSGPPMVAGSAPPTTLEEAIGLAIADTVGAAFGELHHAQYWYQHWAAAYRARAVRLAAMVAEVSARGCHRERILRVFLHWRLVCPRGAGL